MKKEKKARKGKKVKRKKPITEKSYYGLFNLELKYISAKLILFLCNFIGFTINNFTLIYLNLKSVRELEASLDIFDPREDPSSLLYSSSFNLKEMN